MKFPGAHPRRCCHGRSQTVDTLRLLPILLALVCQGCATYHDKPLNDRIASRELAPPSMAVLQGEAEQLRHPLLKPIALDLQDGLGPIEAAVLAVLVNPQLRAERDQRGVSAAQLQQAGILPNPRLSASLDFPTGGDTQGVVTGYGLGLSYDLSALIARGARIDAAREHAAAVNLEVAWQEWQVAEAAKLHTYRLYLRQKQLAVATAQERGLRKNLQAVQHAVDLGNMTAVDLAAARASLEKVHDSVMSIEGHLRHERVALNRSLGFPPHRAVRLQKTIALPDGATIPPLDSLLAGISRRRMDLVALQKGYSSQQARVRAAILGQFPKITLGFSHGRDTDNVVATGPALTISLPFFDRNQGQIALARATRKRLYDEYLARLFEARSNVAQFATDLHSINRQIAALQHYLPALHHLVQRYHRALLQGNADVLTYYDTRDRFITTRLALLNLQLQLVDQFVALEIASGQYLNQAPQRHKAAEHN